MALRGADHCTEVSMTRNVFKGAAIGALSLFALAGTANAASVTFGNFVSNDSSPLDATVKIEQNMNMFTFSLDLADGDTGRITGFYVGTTGDVQCSSVTALLGSPTCSNDPSGGNNNNNLNGLIGNGAEAVAANYNIFDFKLTYPQQGNELDIDEKLFPVTLFKITSDTLTLADFENIGLRFQDSNAPGGSEKLFSDKPVMDKPDTPDMPAVPLPAAGFMLLAGLGGLAAARRRTN